MAWHKLNTLIFIKYLRTLLEKYSVYPTFAWTSPFADPTVGKETLDARVFSVVLHRSIFPSLSAYWPALVLLCKATEQIWLVFSMLTLCSIGLQKHFSLPTTGVIFWNSSSVYLSQSVTLCVCHPGAGAESAEQTPHPVILPPRLPLRWLQRAAALWRLHSGLGSLGGCLFLTPVDLTFIHFTVDLTGYFLPRKLRPWAVGTRHLFWHHIMQIFFFLTIIICEMILS